MTATDQSNDTPASDPAQHVLQSVFGYRDFRGQQSAIIAAAVAGRDALVLMPTGGGKSLCYQIPAILRDGVGLIVSPLIALMQDQVSALEQLGVDAAYLNSTLTATQQASIFERLEAGQLQLLYIAPERLMQAATLQRLARLDIAMIAIDEAHCVSQWGHDFRQDYLTLNQLARQFPGVPRMALTATATVRTREEILQQLELHNAEQFVAPFDRPNIRYSVHNKVDARRQLAQFLSGHQDEAGIVYCMSRKKVDSTAQWLSDQGHTALPYHAGLNAETRARNQKRFLAEDRVIIVATIAFGMGIDKPDVRFVVHLDLPKSVESYYQETGRAGRDGEPAEAFMVYGLQDVVRLRQMVEESSAEEQHKRNERARLDALLGWCESTRCRRLPLLAYFGDTLHGDCGNCDVCLTPPEVFDGTEVARKLLSAVYRTGQRFGAAHVVDVLLGKQTAKVTQHRHDELSVFGIGEELDQRQWRSVVRQLIVNGSLRADAARYGALTLTESSRPLLRGETQLAMRKDLLTTPVRKKTRRATSNVAEEHQELFDALRECRKRLANENNVPPYVIFHDAVLLQMIEMRPTTPAALLEISGVGQAKLERYGEVFLEIIRAAA